ncbi:cyclic nucleotide-binding domain-containing protein [Ruminococcus bromii]|uniref:Crp/Fnr family transcriptional regulator n=1 Tax=Ruminococcus bromii TaxID=40518 RepID=UPI00292F82F1|nr:cyclic nucleotide-binding domain-containing protein [Ruminococcus bromii]MDE8726357.1 cyclic nucleotide-binding domain-containing protein [Ruminococcus bromii]
MRRIRDKKQVEYWLQKGHIRENFDTENLPFSVCRFEKGEYLTRQGGRLAELLFLIEGEVQIYGIREDGSVTPVNRHEAPVLLGDAEFVMGGASSLFTEARTTVICAALPMEPYRAELDRDVKFLHLLLRSYAGKFHTMATLEASAKTIEERVLLYMRHVCANGEISGIETALLQLRCSRRQLQRVLKKLCEENTVEKVGKGKYRLK